MSSKRIILAHGQRGELGVPERFSPTGQPWPDLPGEVAYRNEKTKGQVVVLGERAYELTRHPSADSPAALTTFASLIASKQNNETVFGVGEFLPRPDYHNEFPNIERAILAQYETRPGAEVWFSRGETLMVSAAFQLLEAEKNAEFHETIVENSYPNADVFMPEFDESAWTEPEVVEEFPASYSLKGRRTQRGIWLPEPLPTYRIQVRRTK